MLIKLLLFTNFISNFINIPKVTPYPQKRAVSAFNSSIFDENQKKTNGELVIGNFSYLNLPEVSNGENFNNANWLKEGMSLKEDLVDDFENDEIFGLELPKVENFERNINLRNEKCFGDEYVCVNVNQCDHYGFVMDKFITSLYENKNKEYCENVEICCRFPNGTQKYSPTTVGSKNNLQIKDEIDILKSNANFQAIFTTPRTIRESISTKGPFYLPPVYCKDDQHFINGKCRPKCGEDTRLINGVCVALTSSSIPQYPLSQIPLKQTEEILIKCPHNRELIDGKCKLQQLTESSFHSVFERMILSRHVGNIFDVKKLFLSKQLLPPR